MDYQKKLNFIIECTRLRISQSAPNFIYEGEALALIDEIERLRQQNAELVAEPSIKMLLAGKKALFSVVEDPTIDDARSVYEAMIAACKATGGE